MSTSTNPETPLAGRHRRERDRAPGRRRAVPGADRPPPVLPAQGRARRPGRPGRDDPAGGDVRGRRPDPRLVDVDRLRDRQPDVEPRRGSDDDAVPAGVRRPPVRSGRAGPRHLRPRHARRADLAHGHVRDRHRRRRDRRPRRCRRRLLPRRSGHGPDAVHRPRDHRADDRHRRRDRQALGPDQRRRSSPSRSGSSCGPRCPGWCAASSSPCGSGSSSTRRAWPVPAARGSSSSTSCPTRSARSSSAPRC